MKRLIVWGLVSLFCVITESEAFLSGGSVRRINEKSHNSINIRWTSRIMVADVSSIPELIQSLFHISAVSTMSSVPTIPTTTISTAVAQSTITDSSSLSICAVQFDLYKYAASGGFAGGCRAFSRALTYPLDTLKTLEQSDVSIRPAKVDYFRGIFLSVLSAIPANALFFVVYYYLDMFMHCVENCPPGAMAGGLSKPIVIPHSKAKSFSFD